MLGWGWGERLEPLLIDFTYEYLVTGLGTSFVRRMLSSLTKVEARAVLFLNRRKWNGRKKNICLKSYIDLLIYRF